MVGRLRTLLGAVLSGVLLVPAGQAVLAPVAYDDPETGEAKHHGIALEDTEDTWVSGGACDQVVLTFTFTLAVDEAPLGDDAVLELSAPHRTGNGIVTETALARPGDPATIEVVQGDSCYEFSVTAVDVPDPTTYTVTCSGEHGYCS